MEQTPKKKAIALCILFAVIYCLHGLIGAGSSVYLAIHTGFASHNFLGWYHILTLALVAAFYLPLAIRINRLTKEANMRVLKGISVFVIIAFSAFLVLNAIAIIAVLINPGFLS